MVRTTVDYNRGRRRWRQDEPVCQRCGTKGGRSADGKVSCWSPGGTLTAPAPCITCGLLVQVREDKRRTLHTCSAKCRVRHYGQRVTDEQQVLACQGCGSRMTGRADRRYCSPACRQRAHRQRQAPPPPAMAIPQAPKLGPRRKHRQTVEAIGTGLAGLAMAARELVELDASITPDAAAQLAVELGQHLRALGKLHRQLKTRSNDAERQRGAYARPSSRSASALRPVECR